MHIPKDFMIDLGERKDHDSSWGFLSSSSRGRLRRGDITFDHRKKKRLTFLRYRYLRPQNPHGTKEEKLYKKTRLGGSGPSEMGKNAWYTGESFLAELRARGKRIFAGGVQEKRTILACHLFLVGLERKTEFIGEGKHAGS